MGWLFRLKLGQHEGMDYSRLYRLELGRHEGMDYSKLFRLELGRYYRALIIADGSGWS